MTKADLIKFLEPFTDETEIIKEDERGLWDNISPAYVISNDIFYSGNVKIERNDGIIIL